MQTQRAGHMHKLEVEKGLLRAQLFIGIVEQEKNGHLW